VYSLFPKTIGEHIRKVRIEMNRSQKDVARQFGVSEDTVTYWENERSRPQIHVYPTLFQFLGYYPFEHETDSIAGKLLQLRNAKGLSRAQFAEAIGVDPATVRRWEQKKTPVAKSIHLTILLMWAQLPEYLKQPYRSH